jgi:pyridoxamine 5'-phosphate oxidase
MQLQDLRTDYGKGTIEDGNIPLSPIEWFVDWFDEVIGLNIREPNAMVLSTVSEQGAPASRVVLLKAFDEKGFQFFTNYESRKGIHLSQNPLASLLFFWPELERQVRIEGKVEKADPQISDEYFNSRPLESRVSAAISPQSQKIASRAYLEKVHADFMTNHPSGDFNRPDSWGGYLLVPHLFEFWQGRSNRLHDRIQYDRQGGGWVHSRLAP